MMRRSCLHQPEVVVTNLSINFIKDELTSFDAIFRMSVEEPRQTGQPLAGIHTIAFEEVSFMRKALNYQGLLLMWSAASFLGIYGAPVVGNQWSLTY